MTNHFVHHRTEMPHTNVFAPSLEDFISNMTKNRLRLRWLFPKAAPEEIEDSLEDALYFFLSEAPIAIVHSRERSQSWLKEVSRRVLSLKLKRAAKFVRYISEEDNKDETCVSSHNCFSHMPDFAIDPAEDIDITYGNKQTCLVLLSQIPSIYQQAVYFHILKELSFKEVGEKLQITASTAEKRCNRGIAMLRRIAESESPTHKASQFNSDSTVRFN